MTFVASSTDREFLAALGKRVREMRECRDWTRGQAAREARVSQRHLAELELGGGNISILLLRRIARALDSSLPELLSGETGAAGRHARIALVGLRGAGKTTLGARLAKARRVPFIELDQEIEKDAGVPLAEIFSLSGQTGYRQIERRVLDRILRAGGPAVISVGGGIVAEPEAYENLLSHCFTIWIKARPEEHMARVIAQGDLRPLAGSAGNGAGHAHAMLELRRLLATREPHYRRAHQVLDTSGETVAQSFIQLKQLLEERHYGGTARTANRNRR